MKKFILTLMIIAIACSAFAQLRKIPSEVTDAFKNRYPHAEKVSWKDKLSSFQAEFILNGTEMSADFSAKGDWEMSEKKLSFDQLPNAVKDGFNKSKYTDWKTGSVVEIDKALESLQYRIYIEKSAVQKKFLFFDANGRLNREALTL